MDRSDGDDDDDVDDNGDVDDDNDGQVLRWKRKILTNAD